ncbi:MAG: carboxypeptidase-like regulatory domain-containing protein [Candidatus Aminicenantales bacterium]
MRRSKRCFLLGMLICSIVVTVSCVGFQGSLFEIKPDGSIGPIIAGVEITFVSEDGSVTRTVTTNSAGRYRIALSPRRYVVTAAHPGYYDYSSAPGFFVVTGEGYQTGNIFMRKRHADLLMITTSLLDKEPSFEDIVNRYQGVLFEAEGLNAGYIELDSDNCLRTFGVRVTNPGDWEEIRGVLREIIGMAEASYIMILGGPLVVPRPVVDACCTEGGNPIAVPSDAWYLDFDNDQIVDEGLSISRMPDLSHSSAAVVIALQTAIELHNRGGYTLDNPVRFTMHDYATPPYGVCGACERMDEFFELMSTRDYIHIAGHGSPTAIYSNYGDLMFSIDYMDSINLQDCHPVIIAYGPCSAGVLDPNSSTLSYEFMKAGAAAYVARTTTLGVPGYVGRDFPGDIEGVMRIGPALFQAMRQTALDYGDTFKAPAGQICLYGDPTLWRH